MNTKKKTTGRPHRVSRAGKGGITSPSERKVLQMNAAGISGGRRKIAQEDTQEKSTTATDIIVHELRDDGTLTGLDEYLRNRGIVHRAMQLLEEWKFLPARIICSRVPVDIIALRKDMRLLVQVISSKKPIPDAKTLVRNYAGKIDTIRSMGTTVQFRKMLVAYSRVCDWKYYEVLPGGLIPAWHLPDAPAQ
ncbi:MAG: hypothetical protein ABSB80_06005 [Methanoregula sp.]|jgi:hypothetical protein|uniref:hypothetical protein n=1 Tax=Methanoregula sp. TaxID=2052170 RepID=UPI003D150DF5